MSIETSREVEVTVKNIGGIEDSTVPFGPGTTVLVGENATNRTSMLTALNAALGGSIANLKTDADEGHVVMEMAGERYTREFERTNGTVVTSGNPYTDASTLVDLYASLFATNRVRRTVTGGGDIRSVLMEPVDTAEIENELRERTAERDRIDQQLSRSEQEASKLESLQKRKSSLQNELAEVKDDLSAVEADIADAEAAEEEVAEAEDLRDRLDDLRTELASVEDKIDYHEGEVERLQTDIEELESADHDVPDEDKLDALRDQRRTLRDRVATIEDEIAVLESVAETARRVSEEDSVLFERVGGEDVTAELDPASVNVECPLCGSHVERGTVENQFEVLDGIITDRRQERNEVNSRIRDLDAEMDEMSSRLDEAESRSRRLSNLTEKVEHHEAQLEPLADERDDLTADIEAVEAEVAEMDADVDGGLSDLYSTRSRLDYRRGRLESQLDDIEDDIEAARDAADRVDELGAEREQVTDEIQSLRGRVVEIEHTLIEEFNDHMATILDTLGYENIERVWMERKAPEGTDPGDATFDLHIVREADGGAVYEDTIDTLSESEREVIGLVVALAGYLAHDVHEEVPFILLDSVEAIDADRISKLVEHISAYADTLVLSLLSEDADALSTEHAQVSADLLG